MPELVKPSSHYKQSFIQAVREAQASGSGLGDTLKWDVAEMEADFNSVLAALRRYEPGNDLPDGFVHSESLWLVEGDEYLGRASLRHTLNKHLREFGGHIGYEVRPSARRQGYGTTMLRLTLERARELGLERVLITCDAVNLGSRRVIEGNGGVLEGQFVLEFHPKPLRRYWITL
ncbi:GNAT family N-acetyltransferase [Deinococcus saxicola]|uniref:GNAT family N-acetyltransferase n=1 Tax=Deinococcus saxicola TaxID=249406 RepID=UPI0039EF92B5